jgi:hypothetical protein
MGKHEPDMPSLRDAFPQCPGVDARLKAGHDG